MNSYLKPQLTLTTATTIAVWILAALFYFHLYPKANTEIQHGHKYKMRVLVKCK